MTTKNPDPGYRLPDGDLSADEIACMILFYPDRDEYRRALWGSLDYLGTWLAWERDAEKRGRQAADIWKNANDLTQECFAMNTCETIISLLTQIEKNSRVCCGETTYVSYTENTIVTTTIVPGTGSAPSYYGETAVTDWDDWAQYVCYHAHKYVDDLIDTAEKLHLAVSAGGYVLDFIAHLFSLVQWRMVEDIIPVNFSVIQAIFNALGEGLIENEFAQLALDFETYREDIVCALMLGDSLGDVIESIVPSYLWTVYYSWLDYETTTAVIYEGGIDGVGYLTPTQRSDCLCEPEPAAPIGYHLEHPATLFQFTSHLNVASHVKSYDPNTGIVEITVTAGGGGNLEWDIRFSDLDGHDPFYHGYVFKLIEFTSACQFYMVYNGKLDCLPDHSRDGKYYAGYNTNQHSGSVWDNWTALFDYTGNHSENYMDSIRQRNTVNNCAGYGASHTWKIQLWGLVQD